VIRSSPALEAVWPEVRRRLLRLLQSRGVDSSTAEDIVQEVAVRLLARQVPYTSADDLMRWTTTVARNLAIDYWRSAAREVPLPVYPAAAAQRVDEEVEYRLRLEAVEESWPRLSERDRRALKMAVAGETVPTRSEAVRWAVQRHAARARLAAMIDGLATALAWLWRRAQRNRGTYGAAVLAATPIVALGLLLILPAHRLLPHGPGGSSWPLQRAEARTAPLHPGAVHQPSPSPRQLSPPQPYKASQALSRPLVPYRRVEVGSEPAPVYRFVGTWPKGPNDHLVCVTNLIVLPDTCADLPKL